VLQEAADKTNPLIERMRFLGIYSNNLEEFYKVRFADLKRRILIGEEQGSPSTPRHLLKKIQARVLKADQEFDGLYNDLLLEMARNQIFLINERQLSPNQQSWLRHYFKHHLRQHITPILINHDTDLIEFLKDDYTYLAVEIIRGEDTSTTAVTPGCSYCRRAANRRLPTLSMRMRCAWRHRVPSASCRDLSRAGSGKAVYRERVKLALL